MFRLTLLLAAVCALGVPVSSSATNTLNFQAGVSLAHGQVQFYWTGDTATTTVLPFHLSGGKWVGGYYLPNNPAQHENTGPIYGQPSGPQTYKLCEDKAQTVCSNVRTVTVR